MGSEAHPAAGNTTPGVVRSVLRRAKISVQPEAVNATSAQVIALIGDVAPYVKPSPEAPKQRQGGGRGNGGRRSR